VQVALLGALLRIVGSPDADAAVSKAALTALVNLSQDTALGKALLQFNTVGRVMEFVREKSCPHIELLVGVCVALDKLPHAIGHKQELSSRARQLCCSCSSWQTAASVTGLTESSASGSTRILSLVAH
jgi:hypothetical protein